MAAVWRSAFVARLPNRHQLAALGRRSQQILLMAGATGVLTGVAVAAFEWITAEVLFDAVLRLPVVLQAGAPIVGLIGAAAALRWVANGASPATADEYIRTFHEPGAGLDVRPVAGRMLAAVATLGGGGALGYEGPSIYAGAAIGSRLQRRFTRYFGVDDAKVLLVAGAAAGVAAIFKAPVTGVVFALEVPYQEDLARRMLLPAAISAAASYVTFVAIAGTEPLLPVAGQPPFNLVDLGGAALVGLSSGLLARLFIRIVRKAKEVADGGRPLARAVCAGACLAAVFAGGRLLGGTNLTLGAGYDGLRWALEDDRALLAIVAMGTLRVAATAATVAGGGTGGLFIPLVIQGALVGRVIGGLFDSANATLFPVVGIAAFLGAGYRVPLAAVVFVAEFTGRPGFVVPGLIAAVVAQLVMGRTSISPYQVAGRAGHLEHRLQLPLSMVLETDSPTVPPDASIEEFFWSHLVGTRQRAVAVVDGSTYLGLARADELAMVAREGWMTTPVIDVMVTDIPVADLSWTVGDAAHAMTEADTDRMAVCSDGAFVGVVSVQGIVSLGEILDRSAGRP